MKSQKEKDFQNCASESSCEWRLFYHFQRHLKTREKMRSTL